MALKLYNTMSGTLEEFKPLKEGRVGLYVCGPTVYDRAHVGHARASAAFDILARHLFASGYQVTYVRNFTDVDDKIINRAAALNLDWRQLAQEHINGFNRDMADLGCLEPTHTPRATEYINEIIEDILEIINNHLAYPLDGDVYFNIPACREYGKLSHRDTQAEEAGARVAVDGRKKHPADFALWKAAKPGEPSWPSPWGPGRPGWHIECSTMSHRLLGPEFDIHGGGQDLIFPHHENELAQSGALGRPMARFWIHNGFVRVDNEKMSKSLGNFFTVRDVLETFSAETLRFFLISKHYRSPLDFSDDALKEAEKALERVYRALEAAEEAVGPKETLAFNMELIAGYQARFQEALDDDLNTAKALGVVFEVVRELNKAASSSHRAETAAYYAALKLMGEHLGLWTGAPADFFASLETGRNLPLSAEEIERLIAERAAARAARNWAEADHIRDALLQKGILLEDKAGATTWKHRQ